MDTILPFHQFINEDSSSQLQKVYCAISTDLGHRWMKGNGKKCFIPITKQTYKTIQINGEYPIMNFNEKIITYLKEKFNISSDRIYNDVKDIKESDSKVKFHKKVEGNREIPKTVYSIKEVSKLGFPFIAKPAQGHSGKGIQIVHDEKELQEMNEKDFDLFSEFIDKKSENRIINFKGEPICWLERTPLNEKAKGTYVGSSDKMIFKYTFHNVEDLPENFKKVNNKYSQLFGNIQYICFDLMEDKKGKVYVIESNSAPGQPFHLGLNLYKKIYEDFYSESLSPQTIKQLESYSKEMIDETINRKHRIKFELANNFKMLI